MATPSSPDLSTAGGGFALVAPAATFTPEDFTSQQRLIAQTAQEFAEQEVLPRSDAIEHQDYTVVRALLRQAGELGLTGVDVPEEYGGLGMDFLASAIVADRIARQGSFSVIFGAHVGLGTLPLVYFGTPEQRAKYLPRLASAEWIGAYALSESSSGSDAMALHTHAVARPGGAGYLINGEKQWISNAGFADLFTVFAKVGGEPTAFLVERTTTGFSTGEEEKKMGIKGSSTRPLIFRDAEVPADAVLGAVGGGQAAAFQILNVGRFKLGASCVGGARDCIRTAVAYARGRHAFGHVISDFGLIQQKIADMALRLFAVESIVYRTVGLIAARAAEGEAHHKALDEFAVECSLVKIEASEMLDRVVDHLVQIHGGYGFVQDYPAERHYRDARVNRIFEGTNEINRLIASGLLLRRAAKGALPLPAAIAAVVAGVGAPASPPLPAAEAARQIALFAAGGAYRRFGNDLKDQQEILAALSDLLAGSYSLQSALARIPKLADSLRPLAETLYTVLADQTLEQSENLARRVLAACETGDALRIQLAFVRRLARREPIDDWGLRRQLAAAVLDHGGYPFS